MRMAGFETTQWSMILASAGNDAGSDEALARLCHCYRTPVLAYLRSRGLAREEAEDLTQSFFAHLLSQRLHQRADPDKGSFRAFLLSALKHFVISEQRRVGAARRGGGAIHVVLDASVEPASAPTPEEVFERVWAQTVVARAVSALRAEAAAAGKAELFAALGEFLFESPDGQDYALVSQRFGMSRNTVAVAVHRLRERLQQLVSAEVGCTLGDPGGIRAEVEAIQAAVGQPAPM
ncbi:MAG: sigma-70 family RNA polymerase sigma factor [Proteobacteria bacterium]|nr:sigma-70 family RNA polymerase sigma factor [Pseudomonadota bacterium]MBS0465372.1 sigma-70 family RNA polymerase sigma factor [Pseudomonadota bacterium]